MGSLLNPLNFLNSLNLLKLGYLRVCLGNSMISDLLVSLRIKPYLPFIDTKTMKRKFIFLVTLLFIGSQLIAQKNFKAGTISRNGSTSSGYINYREWLKNPSTIEFSSDANGSSPQIFGPKDISAFEVAGLESYEAYNCNISMGNINLNRLTTTRDSSSRNEYVFLKVIERGNMTLYRYSDALKERFYIKTSATPVPVELKYFVYTDPDHDTRVIDEKLYINQLLTMGEPATDDFKLQKKINATPYREDALQKVIRTVNNNGSYERIKTSGKTIHPLFGAGAAFSSYSFTGERGVFLPADDYNFSSSSSLLVFGGANFYPNPHTAKFFIRADLSWYQVSHHGTAKTKDYSYNYSWTYDLKYSGIEVYAGAGYNVVKNDKVAIYLSAGPSISLASVQTNKEHESRQWLIAPNMVDEYELSPPASDNSAVSFELRAGLTIHHIDVSAALNSMKGRIIRTTTFNDRSTIVQIRVGYLF
jgi:hypothetical protein